MEAGADALSLQQALAGLLPGQFEEVVVALGVEAAYLSSSTAPQSVRAAEILRLVLPHGEDGLRHLREAIARCAWSPARAAPRAGAPAPAPAPGDLPLTAGALRRLIPEVLRSDSDFNAFCLDYFPAVYGLFGNGMDRQAKLTILLRDAEPAEILRALRQCAGGRLQRYEHLLRGG